MAKEMREILGSRPIPEIKSAYLRSGNEDFDDVAELRGGTFMVIHNQGRCRTTVFRDEFDKYGCYTRIDGQYGVREL